MKRNKINPLDLDQQLCFSLYSASRLMIQAYEPLLKEWDLTYPQYMVMLVLWENDHLSVKAIGERLKLDSGTLSPLLKKLQTKGYVIRSRSSEDERVVVVRLTEQGKSIYQKAEKIPESMACKLTLDEKEMTGLRLKINELVSILEKNNKDSDNG
jgi:MarR family transcriptional regulator, organic hydroperoxide resistance regulator